MANEARPEQPSAADKSANTWAMACHLSALAGFIIPFGNIIGPLVVWLVKKGEFPAVDQNGKEALNFQISVTIYGLVCGLLVLVLIGIPLLIGLVIFDIIMIVMSSVKANNGQPVRYPLCIRFIK
jgi:uncharacterized Tic20 family protein